MTRKSHRRIAEFIQMYFHCRRKHTTGETAYHQAELIYRAKYHEAAYASYESFRVILHYYNKRIRQR